MTPAPIIPAAEQGAGAQSRSVEALLEKRWARLLLPSFSDLFFLAILVWLFVIGGGQGWSGLLADADVGWHIRTGDYILDHRAVPYHDLYSFSKPGAPWYAWEWLSDVIDAGLHRWAGLKGVVLLAALVLGLYATSLVRRMISRGVNPLIGITVALLGIGASTIHFLARPHIFTLLFLSMAVWLIEVDRVRQTRRIWWLVPLTILWTNLHGGFLALIAILGLTAAGTAVEVYLGNGRTIRDVWRYVKLTVACTAASLVNPYGWNLHVHMADYLQSGWIRSMVQEFQSPSFRHESMMQYEALLLCGLMAVTALFWRRHIVEGLWILFWAHMSLASVRHVPVFVAVCSPIIAAEIATVWTAMTAKASRTSILAILNDLGRDAAPGFRRTSLLPWAAALALVLIGGGPLKWPTDFPAQMFPIKIVAEHSRLLASSRLFTSDQWADYLIYHNPQQKVFVDGRSDFYGETVGRQYVQVMNGDWRWRQWMQKYDFNAVLVPADVPIASLLKQEPEWRTLADDGKDILLVRDQTLVPASPDSPTQPRF